MRTSYPVILVLMIMVLFPSFSSASTVVREVNVEDPVDDVHGTVNEYVLSDGTDRSDIKSFSCIVERGEVVVSAEMYSNIDDNVAFEFYIGNVIVTKNGSEVRASSDSVELFDVTIDVAGTNISFSFDSAIYDAGSIGVTTWDDEIMDICPDDFPWHDLMLLAFTSEDPYDDHIMLDTREVVVSDRPYLDIIDICGKDDGESLTLELTLGGPFPEDPDVEYMVFLNHLSIEIVEGDITVRDTGLNKIITTDARISGNVLTVVVDRAPGLPLTKAALKAYTYETDGLSTYEDEVDPVLDISVWNLDYKSYRLNFALERNGTGSMEMSAFFDMKEMPAIWAVIGSDIDDAKKVIADPNASMEAALVPDLTIDGIPIEMTLAGVGIRNGQFNWSFDLSFPILSDGSHELRYSMDLDQPYMVAYWTGCPLTIAFSGATLEDPTWLGEDSAILTNSYTMVSDARDQEITVKVQIGEVDQGETEVPFGDTLIFALIAVALVVFVRAKISSR